MAHMQSDGFPMARDTKQLQKEAENYVAAELLRQEILVAEPMWDKKGTDLLAMLRVADGARFIRIQSFSS